MAFAFPISNLPVLVLVPQSEERNEKNRDVPPTPHLVEKEEEEEEDLSEKMYKRSGRKEADILRILYSYYFCGDIFEKNTRVLPTDINRLFPNFQRMSKTDDDVY